MKTSILIRFTKLVLLTVALHLSCISSSIARDRFEYDPTPKAPEKPKAPTGGGGSASSAPKTGTVLALGEVREVFNAASAPAMAFYVPETNPTIVQVVVEKKFLKKPVYFVKAVRPGSVTGGLVPRDLLDKSGFRPNNILDEARVQAAIRANPITLIVR